MITVHIGFDDTDSLSGGCTTYLAARIIEKITRVGAKFIDFPYLVRLNPNIPYRTRGNAAIALHFQVPDKLLSKVEEIVLNLFDSEARVEDKNTNPGLVFHTGKISNELKSFYFYALRDVVPLEKANNLIKKLNLNAFTKKIGRGVIGALAAIGADLSYDFTFEFLAYRFPSFYATPRKVIEDSVILADKLSGHLTFNNYDYRKKRVLITPHGPDPVLYGIRGETPDSVYFASKLIKVLEPIERWVIYKTNQGTDQHLVFRKIKDLKPYMPAILRGTVTSKPIVTKGGHTFFKISDDTGEVLCAAYAPSEPLNKVSAKLIPGDEVKLFGAALMKKGVLTFNLEKIKIIHLQPLFLLKNPPCPQCGKTLTSAGKDKGFKCKRCGYVTKTVTKIKVEQDREITCGFYEPIPSAHRHLTKPLKRFKINLPKKDYFKTTLFWHFP
ncbi:MAG: DUF1743 domain-containing protein [Candidatus Odinarchaeota archaeon]|nr:DUF1743 domain-containing protein [Candidatus Odinarchaeota archaeon]